MVGDFLWLMASIILFNNNKEESVSLCLLSKKWQNKIPGQGMRKHVYVFEHMHIFHVSQDAMAFF